MQKIIFFAACNAWEAMFDPLNQGDKGAAKPLEKKTELSPEEKLREMEKESGLKGLHRQVMSFFGVFLPVRGSFSWQLLFPHGKRNYV